MSVCRCVCRCVCVWTVDEGRAPLSPSNPRALTHRHTCLLPFLNLLLFFHFFFLLRLLKKKQNKQNFFIFFNVKTSSRCYALRRQTRDFRRNKPVKSLSRSSLTLLVTHSLSLSLSHSLTIDSFIDFFHHVVSCCRRLDWFSFYSSS